MSVFNVEMRQRVGGTYADILYLKANWNHMDNKPATYPPTIHSHTSAIQITIATTDWVNKVATKTATGVTTTNFVWVSPAPASYLGYANAQIRATAQNSNSLTFACEEVPTSNIVIDVIIGG